MMDYIGRQSVGFLDVFKNRTFFSKIYEYVLSCYRFDRKKSFQISSFPDKNSSKHSSWVDQNLEKNSICDSEISFKLTQNLDSFFVPPEKENSSDREESCGTKQAPPDHFFSENKKNKAIPSLFEPEQLFLSRNSSSVQKNKECYLDFSSEEKKKILRSEPIVNKDFFLSQASYNSEKSFLKPLKENSSSRSFFSHEECPSLDIINILDKSICLSDSLDFLPLTSESPSAFLSSCDSFDSEFLDFTSHMIKEYSPFSVQSEISIRSREGEASRISFQSPVFLSPLRDSDEKKSLEYFQNKQIASFFPVDYESCLYGKDKKPEDYVFQKENSPVFLPIQDENAVGSCSQFSSKKSFQWFGVSIFLCFSLFCALKIIQDIKSASHLPPENLQADNQPFRVRPQNFQDSEVLEKANFVHHVFSRSFKMNQVVQKKLIVTEELPLKIESFSLPDYALNTIAQENFLTEKINLNPKESHLTFQKTPFHSFGKVQKENTILLR